MAIIDDMRERLEQCQLPETCRDCAILRDAINALEVQQALLHESLKALMSADFWFPDLEKRLKAYLAEPRDETKGI